LTPPQTTGGILNPRPLAEPNQWLCNEKKNDEKQPHGHFEPPQLEHRSLVTNE